MQMSFKTFADVRAANKLIDQHWFDRETMRFFGTRIESSLIHGKYFITSEQFSDESPRLFSIRMVHPDGRISTVGQFQQYKTKKEAHIHAQQCQF